jgi:hypothetical protein
MRLLRLDWAGFHLLGRKMGFLTATCLTPEQSAALDAVIAAHDPNRVPIPVALTPQQKLEALGLTVAELKAVLS